MHGPRGTLCNLPGGVLCQVRRVSRQGEILSRGGASDRLGVYLDARGKARQVCAAAALHAHQLLRAPLRARVRWQEHGQALADKDGHGLPVRRVRIVRRAAARKGGLTEQRRRQTEQRRRQRRRR